jgi:hypothetical protein
LISRQIHEIRGSFHPPGSDLLPDLPLDADLTPNHGVRRASPAKYGDLTGNVAGAADGAADGAARRILFARSQRFVRGDEHRTS